MKCQDAMKRTVVTVGADDSISLAAKKMRDADIGFLPVIDSEGDPMGVITDRDIAVRAVAFDKDTQTRVKDVMTNEIVCVSADADLTEAEDLMVRHQKSRIVCTDDDGRVIGVISLSDIPTHESARRAGAVFSRITEREAHT